MMSSSHSSSQINGRFLEALARVKARFVASIPDRVEEIACQFERIADGEDLSDCLRGIERELHKIAGIAGSIDFAELGTESAHIEVMIANHLSDKPEAVGVEPLIEVILEFTENLRKIRSNDPS